MSSEQVITSLTYNRPKNVATTATQLEQEYRVSYPTENQAKVEWFSTLDPDNIAQVSTIKIVAGVDGNYYCVNITQGTNTVACTYKQQTNDTANKIASALASVIDAIPFVVATASGDTITVTGAVPGAAFTVTDGGSTTAANLTITTPTQASGIPKHRKIGEVVMNFSVNAAGFPEVNISAGWFDAASSPSQLQVPVAFKATGARSLDQIQTEQGVARPS